MATFILLVIVAMDVLILWSLRDRLLDSVHLLRRTVKYTEASPEERAMRQQERTVISQKVMSGPIIQTSENGELEFPVEPKCPCGHGVETEHNPFGCLHGCDLKTCDPGNTETA